MRITWHPIRSFLIESSFAQRDSGCSVENFFAYGEIRRSEWIYPASGALRARECALSFAGSRICRIDKKPRGICIFGVSMKNASERAAALVHSAIRDCITLRLTFMRVGFWGRVHVPLSGVGVFSVALV
jgi:hypothetical protein